MTTEAKQNVFVRHEAVLLFVVALLLRAYHLGTRSLWLDEFTSIDVASKTFVDIALGRGFDSHTPPFYYLLLHPLVRDGVNLVLSVRALSLICDLGNIFLIRSIFSFQFDSIRGRLISWLAALSPYSIYYAQEARMYPLLELLVLLIYGMALFQIARPLTKKEMLLAIIVGIMGMYTHYYFVLSLGSISLAVFWVNRKDRSRLLQWFTILLLIGMSFLPWVGVITRLATGEGQFFRHHLLSVLPYTFLRYVLGYAIMPLNYGDRDRIWDLVLSHFWELGLLLSIAAAATLRGLKHFITKSSVEVVPVLAALILPAVFALIISLFKPLLSDRYLIVSYPFFLCVLSFGLWPIHGVFRKLQSVALSCIFILGIGAQHFNSQFGNEQWKDVAEYIQNSKHSADLIVVNPHFCQKLLAFYLQDSSFTVGVNPTTDSLQELLLKLSDIEQQKGRLSFWLIERGNSSTLKNVLQSFDPQLLLTTEEIFPLENGIRVYYFVATSQPSVMQ